MNFSPLAAIEVRFVEPQNYNVTEGDAVNITLVTSIREDIFDFTVTLQYVDGTATGESFNCNYEAHAVLMSPYTPVLPSIHNSWQ